MKEKTESGEELNERKNRRGFLIPLSFLVLVIIPVIGMFITGYNLKSVASVGLIGCFVILILLFANSNAKKFEEQFSKKKKVSSTKLNKYQKQTIVLYSLTFASLMGVLSLVANKGINWIIYSIIASVLVGSILGYLSVILIRNGFLKNFLKSEINEREILVVLILILIFSLLIPEILGNSLGGAVSSFIGIFFGWLIGILIVKLARRLRK